MGRVTVALIVSSWIIPTSILVNRIVPEPYMDEIFHVPQAQQYCVGNFKSWDPMITTPPGLYFISLAYIASLFPGIRFIQHIPNFINACSISVLRSTNGLLAVICSILIHDIIKSLNPSINDRKATLYAVVLALYPLHWFFSFLYYTDVASLTLVLAMYLMCLKKNYLSSALLGGVSVVIRQTNVIWMLFVACIGILNLIQPKKKHEEENMVSDPKTDHFSSGGSSVNMSSNLKRRRSGNVVDHGKSQPSVPDLSTGLFSEIWSILLGVWHLKWEIFVSFSPFFALLLAFGAFVVWNGSIVLGAKEAHTVSPHFAQLLYYGLVSACFMAPVHFTPSQAASLTKSIWKNRPFSFLLFFLAATVSFLSVHYFSMAHPYLLADNRHYPFYLWRKVINAHWSTRYLLIPLYLYSWTSIFNKLGKVEKKVWVLVNFMATAACLIPTPLIEFRYYTIPFFFLVFHCHITSDTVWLLMGFLYTSINIFTIIMFLFRPFLWDNESGIQRFIW